MTDIIVWRRRFDIVHYHEEQKIERERKRCTGYLFSDIILTKMKIKREVNMKRNKKLAELKMLKDMKLEQKGRFYF